jgi:tetratricopeptide (TPR) repeat protein
MNEALNGYPEAPDRDIVKTEMFRDAIDQMTRMILPCHETVQIVVYDDNDARKLQLKPSSELMKRGEFDAAAKALRAVISDGGGPKTTSKDLGKAQYDLGIALMYSDHIDEAVEALHAAIKIDQNNKIFAEGLSAAERKLSLQREQQRIEASAVEFGKLPPATTRSAPAPAKSAGPRPLAATVLTNADISEMAKLPDAVVLAKIKTSPSKFDSSPKALRALQLAGVSTAVMQAIVNASAVK